MVGAGPAEATGVSAALTEEPDPRLVGIPTAALRREWRRRKLASRTRDVRANGTNVNGVHKTAQERAEAIARQILAYGRKTGADGDPDALAALAGLHVTVEEAAGIASRALIRSGKYSWAELAPYLGIGRQAAWDRYHDKNGARRERGTQLRTRGQ